MKDPLTKSIYINIGIIAGVLVVAVVGLYLLSLDVAARTQAILTYRSALTTRNESLDTLTQLKKDAAVAAGYQTAINRLLSSQDSLIGFPQGITTVARSFNVGAAVDFQSDPVPATTSTLGYINFSLRADGASTDLLAFLKNIESQSAQFLLTIDAADLAVSDPSSRLTARGRIFFQ